MIFSNLGWLEMMVRGCHCCLQLPIPDHGSCPFVLRTLQQARTSKSAAALC